jgi:hypothetical protein
MEAQEAFGLRDEVFAAVVKKGRDNLLQWAAELVEKFDIT